MSDNDVSIPPLRTGVVFAEWAPVVRDKLKAAKHGIIFRMPDPRKRSRFTGSSQVKISRPHKVADLLHLHAGICTVVGSAVWGVAGGCWCLPVLGLVPG